MTVDPQGIKIFYMSYNDINQEPTYTINSNSALVDYMFDRDPWTIYRSSGLNDDTKDLIVEVDYGLERVIDEILLINTNAKDFDLDYWNGTIWVNILTITNNTLATYCNSFTPVTTEKTRLVVHNTQVANEEKAIREFIITQEIGQFEHYPAINLQNTKDIKRKIMINGKKKLVYNRDSKILDLTFKTYISSDDRTLLITLWNLNNAFLIWLTGGNEDQFLFNDEGYRNEDVYLVGIEKPYNHTFYKNLYRSGINLKLSLTEVT